MASNNTLVCGAPPLTENATQPLVGNLTFYQFNIVLSGACTAFASAVAFLLIFLHGTHFSNPAQQIKIIRIIMFIPTYSLYSFLCILFPTIQVSMVPWQDLINALALGNFFLLLLELISPHEDQRSLFFAGVDLSDASNPFTVGMPRKKKGNDSKKPKKPIDVLAWYRRKWIAVFQFVLVAIFVGIITDVTEATDRYCDISYNPKFAHIWMTILINVSEAAAITAVIMFYQASKKHLATHRPLAKLAAFKGILGFTFLSGILFLILKSTGALKPTPILTYADIKVGIPTLVTLLVMVFFSVFFHWAYSYKFYVIGGRHSAEAAKVELAPGYTPSYQGGFGGYRAYMYALSPLETLQAIAFAFKLYNPASKSYVRHRLNGPDGETYAKGVNSKGNSGSSIDMNNHMPGYEPMRRPENNGPASPDYATANFDSTAVHEEYTTAGGYLVPGTGGYHHVPNTSTEYAPYGGSGRGISPPSRSHSRSPSREQFLPPPNVPGQGQVQPGAYGPLNERDRY